MSTTKSPKTNSSRTNLIAELYSSLLKNPNPNSGKSSNRTTQTITSPTVNNGNPVTTKYCYDYADRLISSTDPAANGTLYDAHGNMTQIGPTPLPLRTPVDSSDRNRGLEQYDTTGNGKAYYYDRDAQGRIITRAQMTISNYNWICS